MRRITAFLVLLLVFLLQATAIAGMHTCPTCPPGSMANYYGTLWIILAMIILTVVIMYWTIKPGGSILRAIIVAMGSISFALLAWEPFMAITFGAAVTQAGMQTIVFFVFTLITLGVMLILAGPSLGKPGPIDFGNAFLTALVPTLFLSVGAWVL